MPRTSSICSKEPSSRAIRSSIEEGVVISGFRAGIGRSRDDGGTYAHSRFVAVLVLAVDIHRDLGPLIHPRLVAYRSVNRDSVAVLDRTEEFEVHGTGVVEDFRAEKPAKGLGGESYRHPAGSDGVGCAQPFLGEFRVVVDVFTL